MAKPYKFNPHEPREVASLRIGRLRIEASVYTPEGWTHGASGNPVRGPLAVQWETYSNGRQAWCDVWSAEFQIGCPRWAFLLHANWNQKGIPDGCTPAQWATMEREAQRAQS